MLTRKDFAEAAVILGRARRATTTPGEATLVGLLVTQFADWFRRDNPRFDRGRFLDAVIHEGKKS